MTKGRVDPAALLIAVIAVANTPLTTIGAWDLMNTIVGVVVLVVVCAYTAMGERRHLLESNPERVAVSVVIGLVSAIALAFPLQALHAGTMRSYHPTPPDSDINFGTYMALGFGLIIAIGDARVIRLLATIAPSPGPFGS